MRFPEAKEQPKSRQANGDNDKDAENFHGSVKLRCFFYSGKAEDGNTPFPIR